MTKLYRRNRFPFSALLFILLAATMLLLLPPAASLRAAPAPPNPSGREVALRQARQLLRTADREPAAAREAVDLLAPLSERAPQSAELSLMLAEAWYRAADADADIEKSYPLFEKAAHYAKLALQVNPSRQDGHYWFGLTELRRAQKVGGLRAYFITRHAIEELERVCRNRPGYDFGGAARVLCLLYRVAPGWSPFGDLKKSIAYGRQAVRAAPDYPLNHFYLAQSYLKADDKTAAAAQFRKVLELPSRHLAEKARRQLQALGEQAD